MTVILECPDETALRDVGARVARMLEAGDVIALHGDLGAGKTTFSRGLIADYSGTMDVPSPTYTLVQMYDAGPLPIWHFDLYRLKSPDEVVELGWDETQDGIALIEWPDRAGDHLPEWRLDVTARRRLADTSPWVLTTQAARQIWTPFWPVRAGMMQRVSHLDRMRRRGGTSALSGRTKHARC